MFEMCIVSFVVRQCFAIVLKLIKIYLPEGVCLMLINACNKKDYVQYALVLGIAAVDINRQEGK